MAAPSKPSTTPPPFRRFIVLHAGRAGRGFAGPGSSQRLVAMTSHIDPKTLKAWLHDGGEIALLDVREHGQYGQAHLFYGIPLPFSRLEADAPRLVPRRSVRLVAYDDGASALALRSAERLPALGPPRVPAPPGGAPRWATPACMCCKAAPPRGRLRATGSSPASTCPRRPSANWPRRPIARPVSAPTNWPECSRARTRSWCSTAVPSASFTR